MLVVELVVVDCISTDAGFEQWGILAIALGEVWAADDSHPSRLHFQTGSETGQ